MDIQTLLYKGSIGRKKKNYYLLRNSTPLLTVENTVNSRFFIEI